MSDNGLYLTPKDGILFKTLKGMDHKPSLTLFLSLSFTLGCSSDNIWTCFWQWRFLPTPWKKSPDYLTSNKPCGRHTPLTHITAKHIIFFFLLPICIFLNIIFSFSFDLFSQFLLQFMTFRQNDHVALSQCSLGIYC